MKRENYVVFTIVFVGCIVAVLCFFMGGRGVWRSLRPEAKIGRLVQKASYALYQAYCNPGDKDAVEALKKLYSPDSPDWQEAESFLEGVKEKGLKVTNRVLPVVTIVSIEFPNPYRAFVETKEDWALLWSSGMLHFQNGNEHRYVISKVKGKWVIDAESWAPQFPNVYELRREPIRTRP